MKGINKDEFVGYVVIVVVGLWFISPIYFFSKNDWIAHLIVTGAATVLFFMLRFVMPRLLRRQRVKADKNFPEPCKKRLEFFDPCKTNGWLSNFYRAPIMYQDQLWQTSEHLYQGLKFPAGHLRESIRLTITPREAKNLAHSIPTWDFSVEDKARIMRIAVREKFLSLIHI